MSTNLCTFILLLATCADSLPIQSKNYITVKVGSTAVLPCDWRKRTASTQLDSQIPHVEWHTVNEMVFERAGAVMFQREGYKDRADVPEDKLQEGDCSLVLKNVRPADAGVYMSYMIAKKKKKSLSSKRVLLQSVELLVDDTPKEIYSENIIAKSNTETIHTSSWITYLVFLLPVSILFRFFVYQRACAGRAGRHAA